MQIRISDLMDECCPTGVTVGGEDRAMARRVHASVMEKIDEILKKVELIASKILIMDFDRAA